MNRLAIAMAAAIGFAASAEAGPAEEARRVYAEFVAAQNAHDLDRVRGLFVSSDRFLWVTNGLPVWGPDAALRRLARFHANEVWRIETDEARSRAVTVNGGTALLTTDENTAEPPP